MARQLLGCSLAVKKPVKSDQGSGKRFRLQVLLPGERITSPGVFGSTSPRKFFLASLGTISVQIRYVMKSKMRFRRARKTLPRPRTIYFPKMVVCRGDSLSFLAQLLSYPPRHLRFEHVGGTPLSRPEHASGRSHGRLAVCERPSAWMPLQQ